MLYTYCSPRLFDSHELSDRKLDRNGQQVANIIFWLVHYGQPQAFLTKGPFVVLFLLLKLKSNVSGRV